MTIDIQKYNRVLEEMLLGLEGLKSWDKPEVLRILTPMFEVMHIAKFWWVYYPNRRAQAEREAARAKEKSQKAKDRLLGNILGSAGSTIGRKITDKIFKDIFK